MRVESLFTYGLPLLGRAIAAGVLVAAGTSGAIAPTAWGGTFSVSACDGMPEGANNAWTEAGAADAVQVSAHAICPAGVPDPYDVMSQRTGIGVFDNVGAPGDMPPDGTYLEWRLDAPAGTRIVRAVITRDIGNRDYWTPYGRVDGDDQTSETCQRAYGQAFCRITGTRDFNGLDATQIAYGVRCHYAPYCSNGGTLHDVWVLILSATVYLDDTEPPTVTNPAATGLADGEWHRAPGSITFDASDNTGIKSRRVVSGSTTVGQATAPGAAAGGCGGTTGVAYSYTQPCAGSRGLNGTQSVTVDPCLLGTGTHALRVAATDTGAAETQSSGTVSVKADCTGPTASVDAGAAERLEGSLIEPTFAAADAHSGVASTERQFRIGAQAWQTYTSPITAAAGTTYRFRARATDVVGNVGVWTESSAVQGKLGVGEPPPPVAEPVVVIPTRDDPVDERTPGTDVQPGLPVTLEENPADVLDFDPAPGLVITVTRASLAKRLARIRGRANATAKLDIAVRVRVGRRTLTVRRSLAVRPGPWSAQIRLPARARRARSAGVTVTSGGILHKRLTVRAR